MAKLIKTNKALNPRETAPGDIVVRRLNVGLSTYWMVGEWPGRGTRTLMNLETGVSEQISETNLANLRLITGSVKLSNERIS